MQRIVVQIFFLIIFLGLLITGKAQFWLAFVLLSILAAAFLGRYYCGWACPIHTLMRPTAWLAKKFGLARRPVSPMLKSEKPRIVVLLIFLVGLAYTIYSITQGKKFPLPLIVIPFGLLATILLSPTAWHRYLCPWGTLFSFTGRFAPSGFQNASSSCSNCGTCMKGCPASSVTMVNKKKYESDKSNCLMCFQCKTSCPQNSMNLTGRERNIKGSAHSA